MRAARNSVPIWSLLPGRGQLVSKVHEMSKSAGGVAAHLAANAWDAETAEWAGHVQVPGQPHVPNIGRPLRPGTTAARNLTHPASSHLSLKFSLIGDSYSMVVTPYRKEPLRCHNH